MLAIIITSRLRDILVFAKIGQDLGLTGYRLHNLVVFDSKEGKLQKTHGVKFIYVY